MAKKRKEPVEDEEPAPVVKAKKVKKKKAPEPEPEPEPVEESEEEESEEEAAAVEEEEESGDDDEEEDAEEEEEEEEDAAEDGEKQDIPVECLDCGETFQFTVGDQEFYETKGFEGQPKRCKDCRWAKKQAQEGGSERR